MSFRTIPHIFAFLLIYSVRKCAPKHHCRGYEIFGLRASCRYFQCQPLLLISIKRIITPVNPLVSTVLVCFHLFSGGRTGTERTITRDNLLIARINTMSVISSQLMPVFFKFSIFWYAAFLIAPNFAGFHQTMTVHRQADGLQCG